MKIKLVSLTALAAFTVAPLATQASDKEVVNGHYTHACQCKHHQQVALFVSGRGVGDDRAQMQTVQVGQGVAVTFYAGNR